MPGRSPHAVKRGFHPLVWALFLDLDALWRRLGSYSDPGPRLVEGLSRWVKRTGKGQVPAGEWWDKTLAMVRATVAVLDLPAAEEPRIKRWL